MRIRQPAYKRELRVCADERAENFLKLASVAATPDADLLWLGGQPTLVYLATAGLESCALHLMRLRWALCSSAACACGAASTQVKLIINITPSF